MGFMAGKTAHAQENYCSISFKKVRITNDISNKTYRSHGYKLKQSELKKLTGQN